MVSGRVQGVYYRSYCRDEALKMDIKGWVLNRRDGRVEAVFEGEEEAVKSMVDWCWRGSPSSRVTGVEVEWEEATGDFDDFSVAFGYRG